ncbi:hypothetical protein SAMN05428958_102537 [Pantoea sesami]|nr:hypothetical protein SAMN05428958_102537 [Pantoea sesami]
MDPLTISSIASVMMNAGPALVRAAGRRSGGDAASVADAVAGIVENVKSTIIVQDQQRELEHRLAAFPLGQLAQLQSLSVEIAKLKQELDSAILSGLHAEQYEQQDTVRNDDSVTDEYVRRTRPLMARLSVYSSIAYVMLLSVGQQVGAIVEASGRVLTMPSPEWDIALMLATPALWYLGFRTLDGFARYSKFSKHKMLAGEK